MEFLDKNLFRLSFRTLKIKKKGSKLVITNISNKHSICLLPEIFLYGNLLRWIARDKDNRY